MKQDKDSPIKKLPQNFTFKAASSHIMVQIVPAN